MPKLVAGADVAFKRGRAIGAVVVLDYPEFSRPSFKFRRDPAIEAVRQCHCEARSAEAISVFPTRLLRSLTLARNDRRGYRTATIAGKIIEQVRKVAKISYPYIPGLLTFREGPILEECFLALKNKPDVIIFDGQGIAHPRNMGIATHLGILLDRATIGCAKSRLYGRYVEPADYRGSFSYLLDTRGKKIGAVLRTKDNVRAVYVSPGHRMDIASSIRIVLACTKKYRLPEPIRVAHQLTKSA